MCVTIRLRTRGGTVSSSCGDFVHLQGPIQPRFFSTPPGRGTPKPVVSRCLCWHVKAAREEWTGCICMVVLDLGTCGPEEGDPGSLYEVRMICFPTWENSNLEAVIIINTANCECLFLL